MPDYCKNCGARITDDDQFCPDCGAQLKNNPRFCESCGHQLKNITVKEESFFKKHQNPLIIIAALIILAVIGAFVFSTISIYGAQEVQVDTFSFEIPANFEENIYNSLSENDNGLITESKFWEDADEFIQIDVMYSSKTYVDANSVNDGVGGQKETRYGYEGYYTELADAYTFSFVKDNKLCTIYTSSPDLLDKVEVL